MKKNISIFVCMFLGLSFLLTPALVAASYKEEALEYFFKAQGSPDSNEQIANYQKAIEIEPDFIEAYVNLSALYLRIGKPDDAVRLLEDAHSRHPDNGMIKQHLVIAYITLGVDYYSAQRTQDEIAAYQKALELDSKNVMATNNLSNAYNTLGVALYNQKQMRASWEAFNKALVLNPDNHSAKNNLQRLFRGAPPPESPTPISKTPTPAPPTPTPAPPTPTPEPPTPKFSKVPNLFGMDKNAAMSTLDLNQLDTGIISYRKTGKEQANTVVDQSPEPGRSVQYQTPVNIVLEQGVSVPNVIGLHKEEAVNRLSQEGLIGHISRQTTGKGEVGTIVEQNPSAGTSVRIKSAVALVVEVEDWTGY